MPKKTERPGILSIHERDLIREVDRQRKGEAPKIMRAASRLAQLLPDLDKRISALGDDLSIILQSKALQPFVAARVKELYPVLFQYQTLQEPKFGYDYSDWQVKYVRKPLEERRGMKTWKKKQKPQKLQRYRSYWLEINHSGSSGLTLANIFSPEYAVRGIENYKLASGDNLRDILIEAVELQQNGVEILPLSEEGALTIESISKRLENHKKVRRKDEGRKSVEVPRAAHVELQAITDPQEKEKRLEELFKMYESPDNPYGLEKGSTDNKSY